MDLQTSHSLIAIIEIVWLDLILSGDNAVLLALATRALPIGQRRTGVMLGAISFMLLRILLAFSLLTAASAPSVGLIGSVLLIWAAIGLGLRGDARPALPNAPIRSLLPAIASGLVADAAPALQNMLALQAASQGARPLVLFGLALSIPMLALGSSQIIGVLRKPPLLWAGVGLLGWIAGQLAATDILLRATPMPPALLADFAPPVMASLTILLAYGFLRGKNLKRIPQD